MGMKDKNCVRTLETLKRGICAEVSRRLVGRVRTRSVGFAQSFSTPPSPSLNEAVEGLRIAQYAAAGRKGLRPLPAADVNLLFAGRKGLRPLPTLLRNAGRAGSPLPAALPKLYPLSS